MKQIKHNTCCTYFILAKLLMKILQNCSRSETLVFSSTLSFPSCWWSSIFWVRRAWLFFTCFTGNAWKSFHRSHTYANSHQYALPGVFSQRLVLRIFSRNNTHWKGLIFVWWFISCLFLAEGWLNILSQKLHLKGFSPVWDFSWLILPFLQANNLGQKLQAMGFSPVWLLSWTFL